ncbi:MAG: MarR family transcriptional regulator [Actinomycetota bacterium]|nr:MarR family transcriptional regulator [Actinomycetota bacterium]
MRTDQEREVQALAADVVADCLAYRARRLSREITRLYNDHLRPVGLNVTEMNLLAAVAAQGGAQPARLSRGLQMEKSTLSRNLKRLADQGWVAMRPNPEGRGDLVVVTGEGATLLRLAIPAWEEAQRRALKLLDGALIPGFEAREGLS